MNAQAGGGSAPAAAGEPTTPGELLRQERERRAFSVQQAAEDLHLDVWMIEAIEANRFAALGAPVYAKGHLRKYAALLGLSPEFVIERYDALGDTPAVPTPVPATAALAGQRERASLRAPLWIVVVVLAAVGGWALFDRFSESRVPAEAPAAVAPAGNAAVTLVPAADESTTDTPAGEEQAGVRPQTEPGAATAASQPVIEQVSAAAADASSEPAATNAQVRLHLEFSEPCWTEVYDATGKQLLFDLGAPGGARTVSGVPPLHVTLGLAAAVTAQVDDRPIIVPRRAGRDAARFSIAADGSVNPER